MQRHTLPLGDDDDDDEDEEDDVVVDDYGVDDECQKVARF